MGTSKGYLPPTGYLWSDVKRDVTKMVRNDFSISSVGKGVANFSRALNSSGGTKARDAVQNSKRALSFISSVQNVGFFETLERYGLSHLKNQSPDRLREGLINYFSESGSEIYESVASRSMNELMRELLKGVETVEEYENIIKGINQGDFIREFIIKFIQTCFFTNFAEKLLSLFDKMDKYDIAERSVKAYIRNSIEREYTVEEIQNVDWSGNEGGRILNEKYNKSLEILEVWSEINA